jgi:hypothetical protein
MRVSTMLTAAILVVAPLLSQASPNPAAAEELAPRAVVPTPVDDDPIDITLPPSVQKCQLVCKGKFTICTSSKARF